MGKVNLKTVLKNFLDHYESLEESVRETTRLRKEAMETRRATPPPLSLYDHEFIKLKELTEALKSDTNCPMIEGHLDVNRKKNRYKDILPYDQSRVILSEYPGVPGSDYINANYVRGSSGNQRAYIACQGPLPSTLVDFWRMIWETEVLVVIMACNEREAGRYKCEPYWPTNSDEKQQYGNMTVELVKWRQVCPDFLVRTFKVATDTETRTICQFHYTTWPDHGVPSSVNPILELVRLMRDVQSTESRPILVHCSAGCGRTGTICSIDYVWALLRTGKLREDFSLYEIISDMRRQRIAMVQTVEQYMLCYKAVATLFEQHLKLIDTHTYQNVDDDGEPLMKSLISDYYANGESSQSSQSITPEIKIESPALETPSPATIKSNNVIEPIVKLEEEDTKSETKEPSSDVPPPLFPRKEEEKELKKSEDKNEINENNIENNENEQSKLEIRPEKLVGKAAIFRRPSIAKLKAIFDNSNQNGTTSSSSSSTTASRTSLNAPKLYRSQSIKEDIRNLNFNFSFEFNQPDQPQSKLKKSYTLNSTKFTIYRKNLSIANLRLQDETSPTDMQNKHESSDNKSTDLPQSSNKPETSGTSGSTNRSLSSNLLQPIGLPNNREELSDLECSADMATYPAKSIYIDRQRSQSQLQPYRPPSPESPSSPNGPPKPPRTFQHVLDDSCLVRTAEGRLIVTVAQPRNPNFVPINNTTGNNSQHYPQPSIMANYNSIYEQLRTRYKSSPNLNFGEMPTYLPPSMLSNQPLSSRAGQPVKRANNVASEQFYSNSQMAKSFPNQMMSQQQSTTSAAHVDSSYPQFPTANQLKYIDVLSNQHFQHHQAKPIILQQNNYYEPIYGHRMAGFVPPLPARQSNVVHPRPPSYPMLPSRPQSISHHQVPQQPGGAFLFANRNFENIYSNREMCFNMQAMKQQQQQQQLAPMESMPTPASSVSSAQIIMQPKIENVYAEIGNIKPNNCASSNNNNNSSVNNLSSKSSMTPGSVATLAGNCQLSKSKSNAAGKHRFSIKKAFKLFRSKSGTDYNGKSKDKTGSATNSTNVVPKPSSETNKSGNSSSNARLPSNNSTAINPMNGQPMSKPPHSHRFQTPTQWTQV